MKSFFLYLFLITCSYCLKMNQVSKGTTNSLSTYTSEPNYFYLRHSEYSSSLIYFYLEDNGFSLSYSNLQYCQTNTNPYYYPDRAVSNCEFSSLSLKGAQKYLSPIKYYYSFDSSSSYYYTIIYYYGTYSSGILRVTSNDYNLLPITDTTKVYRNSRKYLTTSTLYDKFFYLTNNDYSSNSSYIYILLEDNNFGLDCYNLQFCLTDTNPGYYIKDVLKSCSFSPVYYSKSQTSPAQKKYYYKLSYSSSYTYTLIYYSGSNASGYLYVTSDYDDLYQEIKMTSVYRNSRISLPTSTSYDKFFYLTNNDYSSYSSYIYILLEDFIFNLDYSNVKYCHTDTNPDSYPDNTVNDCSFSSVYYYKSQTSSSTKKYYYKIPTSSSYSYTIIYYTGSYSPAYLYVTSDYNNLYPIVKMTSVYRNSRKSLPTNTSEDKYFYLTNNDYSSYSSNLYIFFEDNGFSLSYSNIKYCLTDTNPDSYPENAVIDCSFSSVSYYKSQTSSGIKKYYYMLSYSSSYTYTLIYYSGSNASGNLYVTSDYDDLYQKIIMTSVYRNSRIYLPTLTLEDKYFYLTNSEYSLYSSYIYILLEDKNFGLDYSNVKYCRTDTNPDSYQESAVRSCTFYYLECYSTAHYSYSTKYYYKFSYSSSYTYTIISYSGSYSSGSFYATTNDEKFSDNDSYEDTSTVIIISVTIGVFIFLVVFIIILIRCCRRRRMTKINNSIPVTQPTYAAPASYAYPVDQPAYNYGGPIPLQTAPTPMAYQAY